MIRGLIFTILLLANGPVQAICMLESHALNYNCIALEDEFSQAECEENYGEGFHAYVETPMCSKLLAASLRGEDINDLSLEEPNIQAACFSYEQGQKLGCEMWDYEPAYNYCASNYGDQYLPHTITSQCSVELADEKFGYVSAQKLIVGLEPNVAEAEAIMEMLDRENLKHSIGNLISYQPNVEKNFHTDVIDGLLGKLEVIQKELAKRSQLKVKFVQNEIKAIETFLFMGVRYLNLLKRMHKIYAYVAHQNNKSLSSYSFRNLTYLNLKLKKVFALEIISKVNLKVKNQAQEMVEFLETEQNKQIYEYQAMSEPKQKVDYAKLVTFLGVRENLNNVWAIDRIYQEDLLQQNIRTCGPFLSFKKYPNQPTAAGFHVIKENKEYDTFFNDYLNREKDLALASQQVAIINEEILINKLKLELEQNEKWSAIVKKFSSQDGFSAEEYITNEVAILKVAEDQEWELFSNHHFRTIVLPADGVLNQETLIREIITAAYTKRLKAIKSAYLGLYVWADDNEHQILLETLIRVVKSELKDVFKQSLKDKLKLALVDYADSGKIITKNFQDKMQQTLDAARIGAKAGHVAGMLTKGKKLAKDFHPVGFEDLTFLFEYKIGEEFQDIKLTLERDERLARILGEFFNQVAERFNSRFMIETMDGIEFKGSDAERSSALYKALFDVAREYYQNNKFEVTTMAKVPEAVLLAREEERRRLTGNPYMLKVYRDDTPVTVHINDFYAAFQKDMRVYISKEEVENPFYPLLGFNSLTQRTTDQDTETNGYFGQPLFYYAAAGPITIEGINSHIDEGALKRLYLNSLSRSKYEISVNTKLNKAAKAEQEEALKDAYKKVKQIKTSPKLFARVFELFKIPAGSIANNVRGKFQFNSKEQKVLAENYLGMIYGQAPVLRNEIKTKESVTKYTMPHPQSLAPPRPYEVIEDVKRPLIHKIGMEAYDLSKEEFDETKAKALISQTFNQAKVNVKDKLTKFCGANFKNYAADENFKDAFKASKYLRQNLMSPLGTTPEIAKRIQSFDEQVKKEIRSKWKAFMEDTVEPVLLWAGLVAIVVAGIVFAIGTFGSGAPASLAAIAGYLSLFLTIEFYVSFPFATALVMTRINTQFIEVPAQLKFQQSLAHSQIDFGKIADYDLIEADRKANRQQAIWTVGLMPLDLLYGYQVGKALKKAAGFTGVQLYKKLTGMKLPKYSGPPKSMRQNRGYRQLVKERGHVKGSLIHLNNSMRNVVARLPRYQMIDESLIRTKALRVALAREFKKLGIANKPWVVIDDLKVIRQGSRNRFKTYQTYLDEHGKLIENLRLKRGLKSSEIMQHGLKYSKFGFVIRSMFVAIKQGRFKSYIKNWGNEIDELYRLQAQIVQNKMAKFDGLINKIEQFKLNAGAGEKSIDDLLRYLGDDDLQLLSKAAGERNIFKEFFQGKQTQYLAELRKVFKDYETMVQSLEPTMYLYGHMGEKFIGSHYRAFNEIDQQSLSKYTLKNETEDIVSFYESIIKQNAFKDDASRILRRDLEDRISKMFMLDRAGNRIYFTR